MNTLWTKLRRVIAGWLGAPGPNVVTKEKLAKKLKPTAAQDREDNSPTSNEESP
jgi:hypothetical protein